VVLEAALPGNNGCGQGIRNCCDAASLRAVRIDKCTFQFTGEQQSIHQFRLVGTLGGCA
jgi:hypothetical protein